MSRSAIERNGMECMGRMIDRQRGWADCQWREDSVYSAERHPKQECESEWIMREI